MAATTEDSIKIKFQKRASIPNSHHKQKSVKIKYMKVVKQAQAFAGATTSKLNQIHDGGQASPGKPSGHRHHTQVQ